MGSLKRARFGSFMRKLSYETQRFVKMRNKQEEEKLMSEVAVILDNDFFILESSQDLILSHDQSQLSDTSFYDESLSDLLSIGSFDDFQKNLNDQPIFRFSSVPRKSNFVKHRRKKPRLEGHNLLELSTSSSEIEVFDESKIMQNIIVTRIRELQKLPQSLSIKKEIFSLTKKFDLVQLNFLESTPTATLSVTKLHFANLHQKVRQSDYFLLVSSGIDVQNSGFIKSRRTFLTFSEIFTFECPLNFTIRVQLYTLKFNAKLKFLMRKAPLMDRLCQLFKSKKTIKENECFEFVDEFFLTREDLRNNEVGTIRDKSKMFKFSLQIDHLNIGVKREGYLKYFSEKFECKRYWCILSGTLFQIFPSADTEENPLVYFDLKYATFAKIDENAFLCMKSVRPGRLEDQNVDVLKSRDNFVILKHSFKARTPLYLHLWMRDINSVIKTLSEWSSSFLYNNELEM